MPSVFRECAAVVVLALAPYAVLARFVEMRVVLFAVGRRSRVGFVRDAVFAAREAARGVLAASGFDVLNVYQPLAGYGVLGLPAARRVPALYTFLSPAPLEYRARERMTHQHVGGVSGRLGSVALWALERACLRRTGRIQVLSEYSAEQLWQLYRIAEDRFVKIPGGVDLRHFAPSDDRTGVRARLGLAKEAPLLLTVRNLEARVAARARSASGRPAARRGYRLATRRAGEPGRGARRRRARPLPRLRAGRRACDVLPGG